MPPPKQQRKDRENVRVIDTPSAYGSHSSMVVDIDIPAVPSKFAVPTTSPDNAIALAVANAVAVLALPTKAPVT